MIKRKALLQGLPAALMVLSAAISICAQDQNGAKHNARPPQAVVAPNGLLLLDRDGSIPLQGSSVGSGRPG